MGIQQALRNLELRESKDFSLILNAGKQKETSLERALDDYLYVIDQTPENIAHFSINISSPNTPELRKLQNSDFIKTLSLTLGIKTKNTWIKLDPDLSKKNFYHLVECICELGFAGLILTNTHLVVGPNSLQFGLSGTPLASYACEKLEWAYEIHKGSMEMISTGGVSSGLEIFSRIARGASLVQIYTALVYQGPYCVVRMLRELAYEMDSRSIRSLGELKSSYYSNRLT